MRDGTVKIIPESGEKTYYHWLENIEPWCISRQLWWGHQVPVWFDEEGNQYCAATEAEALGELRELASRNRVSRSLIGLGYYDTLTPAVIARNVFENPSWYTAYTPYQPEISQGRLEALLNFQTMVADLTGLATANASMLDEATAVVEGMLLARRASQSRSNVFLVDPDALPQTRAVLAHRLRRLPEAV